MEFENRKRPFLCWFFHKWTIWTTLERGLLINKRGEKIGIHVKQECRCLRCGLIQLKQIEA